MESECMEMDLTTRHHQRDAVSQENGAGGKMRVAKSVFSIRSLVDLSENGEHLENGNQNGKYFIYF